MATALVSMLCLLLLGCGRTAYPNALLLSQEACAQLYRDCGEAAKAGTPCVRMPRCPMTSDQTVSGTGRLRDFGIGWPFE